jgi:hypothetical protein
MKRFLFPLFLLSVGRVAFANDDGSDPGYIPDYQQLVREGYGPKHTTVTTEVDYYNPAFLKVMPKPTQAYYGKGFTIYYGFTPVEVWQKEAQTTYAFGYPLEYFRQLMPQGVDSTSLNHYVLEVRHNNFEPGTYVAKQQGHPAAVTTVHAVAAPAALPAIGEKPAQ